MMGDEGADAKSAPTHFLVFLSTEMVVLHLLCLY